MNEYTITSYKLEDIVNSIYGGDYYSFIISEEARIKQVFDFGKFIKGTKVEYEIILCHPNGEYDYMDWRILIRRNKCPKYCIVSILQDLVNRELLPEGIIKVEVVG